MIQRPISRRAALRGMGVSIALPLLEAMLPAISVGAAATKAPRRMAVLYFPHGATMADWTPAEIGSNYTLPRLLDPLKPHQKDLLVLSGLEMKACIGTNSMELAHCRPTGCFLTGAIPAKGQVHLALSADQFAARTVGKTTKLPSLVLGIDKGDYGSTPAGYTRDYQVYVSWSSADSAASMDTNPRLVFERLFSNGQDGDRQANRAQRDSSDKSILDFVLEDARQLKNRVGAADQRNLDQYLEHVRGLEQRLTRFDQTDTDNPVKPDKDLAARVDRVEKALPKDLVQKKNAKGVVRNIDLLNPGEVFEEHVRLMCDLMVLGFQGDSTRIATFMMGMEQNMRSFPGLGFSDAYHIVSHYGADKELREKYVKITRYHVTLFAYLLDKMKAVREGDGTLLDNSMVLYGSGMGENHRNWDLPILLAGKGGGTIKTGQHLRFGKNGSNGGVSHCNLLLSLLDRMGVHEKSFGESTGLLF